jgi:hypothetical protein
MLHRVSADQCAARLIVVQHRNQLLNRSIKAGKHSPYTCIGQHAQIPHAAPVGRRSSGMFQAPNMPRDMPGGATAGSRPLSAVAKAAAAAAAAEGRRSARLYVQAEIRHIPCECTSFVCDVASSTIANITPAAELGTCPTLLAPVWALSPKEHVALKHPLHLPQSAAQNTNEARRHPSQHLCNTIDCRYAYPQRTHLVLLLQSGAAPAGPASCRCWLLLLPPCSCWTGSPSETRRLQPPYMQAQGVST